MGAEAVAGHRRPPDLEGLTFVGPVGRGGFADVYLYDQAFPARRVAVKVLRPSADQVGLEEFQAEANVMAQLSGHPSIVPIYQAGVSADGRGYLVMEYCPPPHLAHRYRAGRLPVVEVLDTGVRIASAVETAHRAGILHRDIKPHNILTSTYGAPLLTDFGIAAAMGEGVGAAYALSVPWSPPESFGPAGEPDVRSDVYSLAATLYSLLTGRSPFEVPGAANDDATLVDRIERQDVARVQRSDVPESLNALLARSMSRRVAERPGSAMAFARAVQEVQVELDLAPTRMEVMDASARRAGEPAPVDDAWTRVRPIAIISPEAPTTRRVDLPETSGEPGRRGLARWLGAGVVVAVVAVLVGVALTTPGEDAGPTGPTGTTGAGVDGGSSGEGSSAILGGPATPEGLQVRRRDDLLRLQWRNPDPQAGDLFLVEAGPSLNGLDEVHRGAQDRTTVEVAPGEQVCVAITTVRSGTGSTPLEECLVAP